MFGEKKSSKILKLPPVSNCFTLAITNKLVVIINSLKVPKIKKILPYEIKFLVSNYSCLQNPWLRGLPPPDPHSLCPLSSTEFVEPPPRTNFLGMPLLPLEFSCQKISIVNCTTDFRRHFSSNIIFKPRTLASTQHTVSKTSHRHLLCTVLHECNVGWLNLKTPSVINKNCKINTRITEGLKMFHFRK